MYGLSSCVHCSVRRAFRYRSVWSVRNIRCKHIGPSLNTEVIPEHTSTSSFGDISLNTRPPSRRWFPVQDSVSALNSRSSNVVWSNGLSDEFGVLSLGAISSESVSTSGEPNLMEHLLRSESSSAVSDWSSAFAPTTVDQSEIGGLSETQSLDVCLEGLLGEGYDVPSLLADLQDSYLERQQGISAVSCTHSGQQIASSSVPVDVVSCTVNTRHDRPGTRQIITDQMRKDLRKQTRQISSASSVVEPIVETVTVVPTTIDTEKRFDPDVHRLERATVEELEEALSTQDIRMLRSLFTIKKWPLECKHLISPVLSLVVEQSIDAEEAAMFFRDLATSSPRVWIRDYLAVQLSLRVAKEKGIMEAGKFLENHRHTFMARPPSSLRHEDSRLKIAFSELFSYCAQSGNVKDCQLLFDSVQRSGFTVNGDVFVAQLVGTMFNKNIPFSELFPIWSRMSSEYCTLRGIDVLFECALKEDSRNMPKRIKSILNTASSLEHPFSCLAELICVFVRLNKIENAQELFNRMSISGRHFKGPLSRIGTDKESLVFIERIAELVTHCMFGERRRGGRRKEVEKKTEIQMKGKSLNMVDDFSVILDYCGISKVKKKITFAQKDKMKKHKVNEEELHELSEHIQTIWIKLAELLNDRGAADRLYLWCTTNRIDIPRKIQKRMERLQGEKE